MHIQRFREPYLPIHPPSRGERVLIGTEKWIKGTLFSCSMCGNCILQETGFEIALDLIDKCSNLPGVSGVHIMSLGWERILPRLLNEIRAFQTA